MAGETSRRERKVVTVVFCDLVGFTSRAESMDPEDVEALLRPYHARVRAELKRHGGTVEKFIGDAVMALFGAPTAHEDDPERAVRAALAIRDFALEDQLELRVGITSGEALVSLDARPEAGEGMAAGDVVNTAARLQSAAPVNGVIVDEATYRATRRAIDYLDAEPVDAKGKAEPVSVWRATAVRARLGVDVAHEARSVLVGRDRELGTVKEAFDRARRAGTPQLLTLVGVPGIGKSRLVHELSRIVEADPDIITWRQGRCLAYGDGVTLWALTEIVKAQAGVVEQDTPTDVADKVGRAVADAVPEEEASWVGPHLLALVGLAEESELGGDRRGEAFAAWRRFLESLAEQRPTVLVFEDLHWADESLLDFVDELVDWITDLPLLVVATARPELLERRPGWGGGKLNATTLALAPLSDEQTAQLLGSALGTPVLPAETQAALLERAGGNPLYAEQFAELYTERGSTDELPLPETLQGIISARLDGLSDTEKALLLDAAVVGKVFWAGALDRDDSETAGTFHSLERKGFVRRQRRSSVEGQSELAFAHALVRDVAYGQIPRAERADKHRRVAEWIESLGRPEDHAEMRAYHWRSSLELARASGADSRDLVDATRFALRDAGDRAYAVNAFSRAAGYFEEALALWPNGEERPALLYRLADALYLADDERAQASLERARDGLLAAGNRELAAEAELSLSRIWWHRGQNAESIAHEARAEELVGGASSATAARVLAYIARTRTIGDDAEGGLRTAEQAFALAEKLGLEELRIHALNTIGAAKGTLGDPTGRRQVERALELALQASSPQAGTIANNVAVEHFLALDMRRTAALFDEGLSIALRFGDTTGARWLRGQQARMQYILGNWDDSLTLADEFIATCEAGAPHYMETPNRHTRALIRMARNEPDAALVDLRRGLALARDARDAQVRLANLDVCVLVFEDLGRREEAAELLSEAIEIMREHPHTAPWGGAFGITVSRAVLTRVAELRQILNSAPASAWRDLFLACLDRDFVRAADTWADAGSPSLEARVRLRGAEELIETGRCGEGEEELVKALGFYRSVGAPYFVQRCQQLEAAAQSESA
jgi:class 3 adenylate cyclase/tetratricopeptide (TPR) repeat protein